MGKYRLYASGATQSPPPPGDDVSTLEKDTPFDKFVASLPGQVLVLASKPDPENNKAQVDNGDEIIKWFVRIDEKPEISVTFTGVQTPQAVQSFEINLVTPWKMTFTSTPEDLKAAFADSDSQLSKGGLAPDGQWLVCALSKSTAPIKTDVKALFDCACIPDMTEFIPNSLLGLSVTLQQKDDTRNALWFAHSSTSPQTVIRLQFKVDAQGDLQSLFGGILKGLTIDTADVICKQNWGLALTSDGIKAVGAGNVMFTTSCHIPTSDPTTPKVCFETGIELSETVMTMTFLIKPDANGSTSQQPTSAAGDLKTTGFVAIVEWLAGFVSPDIETFMGEVLTKDNIASRIHLRRLIVKLNTSKDPESPVLDYVSLDVEISTTAFGQPPDASAPIIFLLSYTWSRRNGAAGTIRGSLWNDFGPPVPWSLAPLLEDWEVLTPETQPEPAKAIDLRYIVPGHEIDSIPDTIPSQITRAYLSLSKADFAIGGTITAKKASTGEASKPAVPQPYLGEVRLDASYSWGKAADFSLELGIVAGLRQSASSPPELDTAATLIGSLKYKSTTSKDKTSVKDTSAKDPVAPAPASGTAAASGQDTSHEAGKDTGGNSRVWELSATLDNLYASSLVEFFDAEAGEHVMPLIESIVIDHLDVTYKYSKSGTTAAASEFNIEGTLRVASIILKLTFNHTGSGWDFSASLNPQNEEASLGDVLHSMLGDNADLDLPDFVSNMKFVAAGKNLDALSLRVGDKTPDKEDDKSAAGAAAAKDPASGTGDKDPAPAVKFFYLIASINIANLGLTFAQIHSTDWDPSAPSKRLFRANVDLKALPKIHVDLIGDLELPLDDMYYLWTQDKVPPGLKDSKAAPRQAGFTRGDLQQLNSIKPFVDNEILVKDKFKTQEPGDLLLAAGSYFGVVGIDSSGAKSCILGYDFHSSSKKPGEPEDAPAGDKDNSGGSVSETTASKPDPGPSTASDDSNPSAHAPLKKKAGPLSVSNVGLRLKGQTLSVMLDANFDLGPLAFSLLGFSIDLDIKTLDTLRDIKVGFTLDGLSAAFEKPPLTIAGVIRRGNAGGLTYYAGGLVIGYVPYQFMAAGFYGEVSRKAEAPYTSVFVFAKLDGPLVSLGFAEISGLTGGFGYNSAARMPAIEDVASYPLVAPINLKDANNALDALKMLTDPGTGGWFSPMDKEYWAAAGIKVDAFQMVSIDAVVLVQFGSGSVKLAIFAVAVADIPSAKSPVKLAHVELGMALTVDPDYGLLKVEAQLAPGSYILAPDCHLTGGMALVCWFDGPHADKSRVGDFVFTLGGYHEAMAVPPGWPSPPRLAISWGLGAHLSISGQAYFAVTPKVCMAGARLHASFSAGPIEAWFDAFADFLVNYKPFHFVGHVSIAVGVSFNIDFLFIHTHISVEIGADLTLWGPPLAGTVHVHLWVASFSVDFGAAQAPAEHVDLYAFYLLVLPASQRLAAGFTPDREKEEPPRPQNEGHSFAATSGLINTDEDPRKAADAPWYVKGGLLCFVAECKMPVGNVELVAGRDAEGKQTTRPVEFKTPGDGAVVAPPRIFSKPMRLKDPMTSTLTVEYTQDGVDGDETDWQMEMVIQSMPTGLWARYESGLDPSVSNTGTQLLNQEGASTPLMTGLRITAPKPTLSRDPYPIFDVADASLVELTAGRSLETPEPANDRLFAPLPPLEDALPATCTDEERLAAVAGQYAAVADAWEKPVWEGTAVRSFVDVWQGALGWGGAGGAGPGLAEMARVPKRAAKHFRELYVAPPLLAAAVAA